MYEFNKKSKQKERFFTAVLFYHIITRILVHGSLVL